ncbi:MAG: DUF523 and DUF1722 domain-containing protein [Gammaproteobacteria bacterium]|nr:DUF523 and DUF1722 domain-containing protein [Gammaproteobacteria bacterium]
MSIVDDTSKIKLGISSCLLGQPVRYDGGHKRDAYIIGTLGAYFTFIPFCPEVAIGLPVPRPTIRLVQQGEAIRVVGTKDPALDVTELLHRFGKETAERLTSISGYILKRGSPSCGMERVKVYDEQGRTIGKAAGAFAHSLKKKLPLLPMEEEGRLGDARLRENFIMRVFVYHRWQQQLLAAGLGVARLQQFHADHKYLVMAHNQAAYKRMGRMVAEATVDNIKVLSCLYMEELMTALARPASRRQHVNVLQHILGYLKNQLDSADKAEMVEVISQYGDGLLPLIVPITLLKHHFRRHPHDYIERQLYLTPHPQELMLHNLI